MKTLGILLGCFAALAPGPVSATDFFYFVDGNQLYMEWQDAGNNFEQAKCIQYILGVMNISEDAQKALQRRNFCPPNRLVASQLRDVVTLWLEKNPQQRASSAANFVGYALNEAFSCQ